MRAPRSLALAPGALLMMALILSACTTKPSGGNAEAEPQIKQEIIVNSSSDDSVAAASTKGLSQEAIDQGFTVEEMPSGWPAELPLPEGIPVSAFRSGETFVLLFDLASVSAGEEILAWYEANNWTLSDDMEAGGFRIMSFDSAETNDYGPLRRVTVGIGMNDWPTAFQYNLEVQE